MDGLGPQLRVSSQGWLCLKTSLSGLQFNLWAVGGAVQRVRSLFKVGFGYGKALPI